MKSFYSFYGFRLFETKNNSKRSDKNCLISNVICNQRIPLKAFSVFPPYFATYSVAILKKSWKVYKNLAWNEKI